MQSRKDQEKSKDVYFYHFYSTRYWRPSQYNKEEKRS